MLGVARLYDNFGVWQASTAWWGTRDLRFDSARRGYFTGRLELTSPLLDPPVLVQLVCVYVGPKDYLKIHLNGELPSDDPHGK